LEYNEHISHHKLSMLKIHTWKTPNGFKPAILLEELGLEYDLLMVDISKGEQKTPEYLALNPNGKIPALVDEDAEGGPLTIFESGAILLYLSEKTGKFMPKDIRGKYSVMEWLMFQMAGVGPMFGQASHFIRFAPEKVEYGIKRYTDESMRLVDVLNTRLGEVEYLGGEYSIADIATYPWIRAGVAFELISLDKFPNVSRWYKEIEARPAVIKAYEKVDAPKA
jgi:GST-like protein